MHLREYLWNHKITIQQFAEKIKYNRHYISQIMRGEKVPSQRLAEDIERATNGEVKAEDILKIKKDNENE